MNEKFIIRKHNKSILIMNIKTAKKSLLGELDIMFDAANKSVFNTVVAGNYYKEYTENIAAVSWHGYFKIEDKIYLPTIHFKNGSSSYKYEGNLEHIGTINSETPFAFPICSLYIPGKGDWLEPINKSNYTLNDNYHIKDIDLNTDQRIDIFITPNNISANQILQSPLGYLYKMADIEMFSSIDGRFVPIKESRHNSDCDCLETIELNNGHDLIIRTVGNQDGNFKKLEGTYSLVVHDPNDAFNRMTNRYFVEYDEKSETIERVGIIKDEL